MGWQAPNLLDKIFEDPKVPDSNVIGNFMGGYLAGKENAGKPAQDTETGGGGASGDADASKGWVGNWMKSTLQGHQMAQNYIGYQEAVTATAQKKAETAGTLLQNQQKQNMLQDSTAFQAAQTAWLQGDTSVSPIFSTQAGSAAWQTWKAGTNLGFSQQQEKVQFQNDVAKLDGYGQAAVREMPLGPNGLPTTQHYQVLALNQQRMRDTDQQYRMSLEQAKQQAMETRQTAVATVKGDTAVDVANIKAEATMESVQAKLNAARDSASSILSKAALDAFKSKQHTIWSSPLSLDEKNAKLDELSKSYGVPTTFKQGQPAPAAQQAPPAAATPPPVNASPEKAPAGFKEGATIRRKSDGKEFKVVNGVLQPQ